MATRALLLLREAPPWAVVGAAAAAALLWLAAWTLEWAWWTPRRLDRALRAQGLKGTRYRLFTGDVTENARLNREARTKPLPLGCHDIIPRVLPMLHKLVKENGNFISICSADQLRDHPPPPQPKIDSFYQPIEGESFVSILILWSPVFDIFLF
jgi:hypothetical protein